MSFDDAIIQPLAASEGRTTRGGAERQQAHDEHDDRSLEAAARPAAQARIDDQKREDLGREALHTHIADSRDRRDHTVWIHDRVALMRELGHSAGAGKAVGGVLRVAPTVDAGTEAAAGQSGAEQSTSSFPASPAPGSGTRLASESAGGSTHGSRAGAGVHGRDTGPIADRAIATLTSEQSGPGLAAPTTHAGTGGIGSYGSLSAQTAARAATGRKPSRRDLLREQKKFTWGANVNMVDGVGRFVDTVESAAQVDARRAAQRENEREVDAPQPVAHARVPRRRPTLSERSWRDHVPAAVAYKV